ncbi:MAG TPA: choice-of-anchor D domain-containing protein [Acidimicrobiia bacterium]|nr:choice-of-anchor D domain-containing protein [Acidimicrobiia bacterium]
MTQETRIHIGGSVSGQVAYGQFVYQVQAPGGTVTQIVVPEPIKARPRPIDMRPPSIAPPVGRNDVLARLTGDSMLRAAQIHAADGWGKTTVLKHLARHSSLERSRDGIGVISGWGRPFEDIEGDLFDAFFESALPQLSLKATPAQIRASMRDVEAVILVDDLDVDRRHLERLLDDAPGCRFVLTSTRQTLLDGDTVALGGLDAETGLALFSNRLGRALGPEESRVVVEYVASAGGQPLAIVWAAAAVERRAIVIEELRAGVHVVARALDDSLGLAERRALGVLGAVRGAPLPADAVGTIGAIDTPEEVLGRLRDDGMVLSASPRYRLPVETADDFELVDMREEAMAGMTVWARAVKDASRIVEASAALIELATWGKANAPEATINMVRASQAGLFLGGEWEAWSELMSAAAHSATVLFDEAWVLHEIGTRDLLIGDRDSASERLHRALSVRTEIGDDDGARVTRYNLGLLEPPPPRPPDGVGRTWLWWLLALVAVLVVGGALLASGVFDDEGPGTTEPTVSDTLAVGRLVTGVNPLEMGEILVGMETEALWSVINTGPGPVDIANVSVDPPFSVGFDCGTVPALEDCEVTVGFTPELAGAYQSDLVVDYDGDDSPLVITVTGSATEEAPLSIIEATPVRLDFGAVSVGDADRSVIEIRNSGEAVVDLIDAHLESGDFFILEDNCDVLEPATTCEVAVYFVDAGDAGRYEDNLIIEHSADNDNFSIPVSVTVIAPPDLIGEITDWGASEGVYQGEFFAYWAVPVVVSVSNLGGEPVEEGFRIHVEDIQGEFPVFLRSGPDATDVDGMVVADGIGPGGSIEVTVFVAFPTDVYDVGQIVPIQIVVDSCFGEEFIEDPPCRIMEGDNEDNNTSEPVEVTIEDTEQIP